MVKMNGCAAIDSVRLFRFRADKAAVAADFHLGNGACHRGKDEQQAQQVYVHPAISDLASWARRYPRCISANYDKTYLASNAHVDTHRAFCKFQLRCPLQKLVGESPKPLNDFFKIGYAPCGAEHHFILESDSRILQIPS